MKRFLTGRLPIVGLLMLAGLYASGQPLWDLTVRYNTTTCVYEVFARPERNVAAAPTPGLADGSVIVPTFTIVLPINPSAQLTEADVTLGPQTTAAGNFPRTVLNFATTNPWAITTGILAPTGYFITIDNQNGGRFENDFSLVAGKEYRLVTFTLTGGCVPGVRLVDNAIDDVTFDFGDWEHTFPNRNALQRYKGIYNNGGTTCSGLDFGDLTSAWGTPRATVMGLDCDGNGVPDGTGGAVWAGNIVDAEPVQRFSTIASLANGDNNDNQDDEDGLINPALDLNPLFTYTFKVRLNSNQAGKTVHYGLWFDWNNNGNFTDDIDPDFGTPAFYSGSGVAQSPVDVNVNVTPPALGSIDLNNYKVRLIVSDAPVTIGMWGGTFANGEVEDYAAPAVVLPVQFGEVTAQSANCGVTINFEYLSQTNNKHFEVEHSGNGSQWQTIGTFGNTGNVSSRGYSYVHNSPVIGTNYYRIKQVDVDGKFSYSKVVSVRSDCNNKGKIVMYPNPVRSSVTVQLPLDMVGAQLRISDAVGKRLQVVQTSNATNVLNTQMLASGMYLIEVLRNNQVVYSNKFVKE